MKILHKSKRPIPPPPQVADLISKLLSTPNDDIADVLAEIDVWKWPRSDLNAWTKVLNKFDAILEEIIRDYDVDKIQLNSFTPATKRTLCEILRFERLLLENSTNRKMFSSYDRLNSLLCCEDLDVLVLALNLLLRPSQQYSAQPSVSHALGISTPRLQSLTKKWPHLREHGVSLVDLAGSIDLESPPEAREVSFTFYAVDPIGTTERIPAESLASPRKPTTSTSAAVNVHITEQQLQDKPVMQVLSDALSTHAVPEREKFELMCRIRTSSALGPGKFADRIKLLTIRLLAVAIFGHTHLESQATSTLFLYEPDLVSHIAELLQVDHDVPVVVQTAAIAALDALARYRSKIQEVLTAVNAGVNHGILMGLVRKTVAEIANVDSTLSHPFIEALLSFVTFIASHASGGNMVVGAGLIPLLIQIVDNKIPQRLPVVSKTMQLVDNILYSFTNAFNLFCTSRGVETLVDRIEYEVDLDLRTYGNPEKAGELYGSHGDLPVARTAVLKHILRSMHRMMQSSGTAEGLRGLIDMSLLRSIKKIIEYRGLFGPSILPIAINIMATFVHNEPTSLTVIQEAGLPEAFYKAIEVGLEPSIEVLQAVPNAIGALCLNEQGQTQLNLRPSIIPSLFSIFTSDRHLKVLLDKENAVLIGTGIDELIRHHPSLKAPVFESVKVTLSRIEDLGNAFVIPEDLKRWYRLIPTPGNVTSDSDVAMADVESSRSPAVASESRPKESEEDGDEDEFAAKPHDNIVVSFIDILNRFLEGLFQHPPHCKDFISSDGLALLGRLTALPCLPYDFANSVSSDSMVQVMRTMTEVSASDTLLHLSRLVKESLEATRDFWGTFSQESKLLPFVDLKERNDKEANARFRNLITLHIRITLLSDVFSTSGYAHGRAAIALLQTLMTYTTSQSIANIGALHRASIWENIALNLGLSKKGINVQITPATSPLSRSPDRQTVPLPDTDGAVLTNGGNNIDGLQVPTDFNLPSTIRKESSGPQENNAAALKHLTHGLPSALAPFFQAMVKTFHARRNPDQTQKKQITESSTILADVMLKHLSLPLNGDTTSTYTYFSVILGLFTVLLVDERTSTHTLHTVQLFAFYRAKGFDIIFDVCRRFITTISGAQDRGGQRSEEEKKELVHAYGGLKVALHLLHPIISSKPIFESGQTVLATTRDKKDTDPDYFEPHNFLVRLRLASLPLLQEIWNSQWLLDAPLSVSRTVVQVVLELINGENEEVKGGAEHTEIVQAAINTIPRPATVDEGRIQMLTDMGFPRSAAERALTRTHNNVNAATELLLAHPFPLPPDPDPPARTAVATPLEVETVAEAETETEVQNSTSERSPSPVAETSDAGAAIPVSGEAEAALNDASSSTTVAQPDMTSEGSSSNIESRAATTAISSSKTSEEWRQELNAMREPLRTGIARQALHLIDKHLSLLFDLRTIFVRPSGGPQHQTIQNLIDDVTSLVPRAFEAEEQSLANRCRLLALVLGETPSALTPDMRATLLEQMMTLIRTPKEISTPPRWLASQLLVTEALFALAEEPAVFDLPKEGDAIPPQPLLVGPSLIEERNVIFEFSIRLLSVPDLQNDDVLSVLRLLVLLTRDREMAKRFVKEDGIAVLFKRLKATVIPNGSSYIAIILRHVAEDRQALQSIMKQAIKRYLSQPRTRIVDTTTFVRNCSAMALRDPATFIEVTQSLAQLAQPFSSSPHLSLKSESTESVGKPQPQITDKADQPNLEMIVDQVPPTSSENSTDLLEPVVHYLMSELIASVRVVNDAPSDPRLDASWRTTGGGETEAGAPPPDLTEHYSYSSFIMQCLTELLFSYDSCKLAFLSYSPKKKAHTPAKESPAKFRSTTVQFLLSELITFRTINPEPNSRIRNRITLCNWAMSVLVALCVDSASSQEAKEVSADLVAVRKFVLEAINRAIKDISPTEEIEARYGRLVALADLCHRLLTVRFNTASRKPQDDAPTHIAKIMLEKNFVATLTTALADVDLNYPHVRGLVVSILRPLEYLSKIAIKMSKTTNKTKETQAGDNDMDVVSVDSDEEQEAGENNAAREETPDLYRNSALGMYGGEMDDAHFAAEDEMEEDDDAEDDDVEMDFEDTGSEDTSNTDEDGEEDELENDAHGSGNDWEDVDDEDEEQRLVENQDGDDDDDDDDGEPDPEGEGDEEADEEMLWHDIHGELDGPEALGDPDDEEGGPAPIQILHEDEDDEPEMMSDEEDYLDNGNVVIHDAFGFGDVLVNPNGNRDGAGLFVNRRHRSNNDDNVQVFGRPRNGPPPPPETTTHPLLLDTTAANRPSTSRNANSRHNQRIVAGGNADLVQTIEDLIGGGAVQFFQHIMARGGRPGGPDAIRLDGPPGTFVNIERGPVQQRRGNPALFSAAIRVERAPRSQEHTDGRILDPLLTLQRWAEEVKILNGEFVLERAGKLSNHVALSLLPAAIEADKAAKLKAEQDVIRQQEMQAKVEAEAKAAETVAEDIKTESEELTASDQNAEASSSASPILPSDMLPSDILPPETQDQATTQPADEVVVTSDEDIEMRDGTLGTGENEVTHGDAEESASSSTPAQPEESTSAAQPQRITVVIHGSAVDITDTGIDPTFLEALPDDMREEVLNQHVRDQRASRVERPPDSQISSEFLDALPPEIRAEIIQQEALERARRRAEDVAQPNAPPRAPAEIDTASFIASLDPTLRQAVLMDQDDGFIQTLPSHMIAEAGVYRDGQIRRHLVSRSAPRIPAHGSTPLRKPTMHHDAIQLLEKPGVAVLVRLLFFPQVLKKTLLFKVLVNLCENSKTRTELFNLLLNILQDGTGDLASVDKSFAQMSVRSTKSPPPKGLNKQKPGPEYVGSLGIIGSQGETIPDLIAQRCLEALTYIVTANEQASLFFLTEHDLPSGMRKTASKKGKGKEKIVPQSHFPVVLLLGLLERQSLLRTPAIMESVVGLLATVTRPLTALKGSKSETLPLPSLAGPSQNEATTTATSTVPVIPSPAHETPSAPNEGTNTTSVEQQTQNKTQPAQPEAESGKALLVEPPQIPEHALQLIVNILTVGECSGRTFQQSLALIQHLSNIPDARDVIASELKVKAQDFGQSLLSDLDELSTALNGSPENAAINSVASKFSPASSVQAKLLRVLKTIDYMYSSKAPSSTTEPGVDTDKVQGIYESFHFTPLWQRLGGCLSAIEEKPDTEHIATVLLPLIEALMVVCKYVGSKSASSIVPRALRASAPPMSPVVARASMEDVFIAFTDAHRKVLNLMVRNNPSLMSGSFSLLVNNPRVLDFDNKRNYFTQQLHRRPHGREHHGTLQLNVRRARVFEDSFQYLQRKTGEQIKHGKLSVRFYDEEGVDAGGVTREWFQILARQMFDPNNALFQPCAADKLTYQPNKNSWVNPEHLSFFKFVGRVIGKAIYDGRLLDAYFARSLYRQLLGKPVDYKDVEWVDPEYYNSLCWILENDPTLLELTFSVEADEFGVNRIVPLKDGGEGIAVTQENKREFVQLSAQYRLYSSIRDQIESLSSGFYEIIPKDLITIFNEQELELLISGTPDIDVDEWRAATEYSGYSSSDPNIVWWWRALKSFNRDERAKVLSFATGTSRVPLSGFVDLQGVQGVQRFSIHKAYGESDRLPQAHTCFNQIDLPQYSSYEMLRQQLLMAINEGGEGFAFS